jgi:hypothetical protein
MAGGDVRCAIPDNLTIPAAAAALLTLAACGGGAVGEGEGLADIEATPSISAGPQEGEGPSQTD